MDSLRDLVRGRTTLIIAHRLSTVRIADEIVVMDEGLMVEKGPAEELMARDSAFRRLSLSQSGNLPSDGTCLPVGQTL